MQEMGGLLEQVEGPVAYDGQVLVGVAGADAAVVLIESHVQHPVNAVLNSPVASGRPKEGSSAGAAGTDGPYQD